MQVSKKHHLQGQVPTPAELNAPYAELATEASNIEDSNTAASWMTLAHMDSSAFHANRLYSYTNPTTSVMTATSSTYTTVSIGGTPAELSLAGFLPDASEATRFSASGLIRKLTTGAGDVGNDNYYAFRLLLTYDDGAGDVTTTIGEWGYSFTSRALVTTVATGGTAPELQYQTFQFSAVRRYDGNTGDREYKKLALQVALNNNGNGLEVSRHQLFAISGRR